MNLQSIKKSVILLSILLGILTLILFGLLYYYQFRGSGPAFKPPASAPSQPPGTQSLVPPPSGLAQNTTGLPLTLPKGFGISTFASNLGGPRVMLFDNSSRLLVSLTSQGKIVALPDENVDGKADKTITLLENLRKPHGLALSCEGSAGVQQCKLLVAEEHQVVAYTYDQGSPRATNPKKIIDLPTKGGGHFTRTLLIIDTPEGKKLLTSIGSSCNVCIEEDQRRAAIYISNLDGSNFKPYVTGLRNSVFMAVHPVTKKVWATEMGR